MDRQKNLDKFKNKYIIKLNLRSYLNRTIFGMETFTGTEITLNGKNYFIFQLFDIVAKIEKKEESNMSSCVVMTRIPTRDTSYHFFDSNGIEAYLLKALRQLRFNNRNITINALYYLRGESFIENFSYYIYEIEGISESEMEAAIRSYGPSSPYNPCELIVMKGGDGYYKYTISSNIML